jgi:hypothetical protein
MSTRLRTWAATGHYREEDDLGLDASARPSVKRAAWRENASVAVLVPVGVVVGALFAVALLARLLMVPFTRSAESRTRREG